MPSFTPFYPLFKILLLVSVVCFFMTALISDILEERSGSHHHVPVLAGGTDPGVRVLLRNRSEKSRDHENMRVIVQQAAVVFAPEHLGNEKYRLQLKAQEELLISPHPTDGFSIGKRNGAHEQWQVARIRIQPLRTTSLPEDQNPLATNPRLFEANNANAVFTLGQRRYRGSLDIIRRSARKLWAVNMLPIESYIAGVVGKEMNPTWPTEALKAQAICSRSYAFSKQYERRMQPFDVQDGVQDQAYHGMSGPSTTALEWAVNDTRGLILTYKNIPFAPYYHGSSGGYTADVDFVFPKSFTCDGQHALSSVMIAKEDPYCYKGAEANNWLQPATRSRWESLCTVPLKKLRQLLIADEKKRPQPKRVGTITKISILDRNGHYAGNLRIDTTGDTLYRSGKDLRVMIGSSMRSTQWSDASPLPPSLEKDYYTFEVRGFGHGVGMSQTSAYAMARFHKKQWLDIVDFFYPGSRAQALWE